MSDADPRPAASPPPLAARPHVLAWLAEGAREVARALEWLPRERRDVAPPMPSRLGAWPAVRHVWHLAQREARVVLPAVQRVAGEAVPESSVAATDLAGDEASVAGPTTAEAALAELAATRFELLLRVEQAPDAAWERLAPLLLHARQHELEHLAALWRIALDWDSSSMAPTGGSTGVPLHPADRLEESH